MTGTRPALMWVAGSYVWLVFCVVLAGAADPNYSHISQFMSELGATGTSHGWLLNLAGFVTAEILLVIGILCFVGQVRLTWANKLGLVALAFYPLLLCVAALFPCDFECRPVDPTVKHNIHLLSAMLAYLSAVVGLLVLSLQIGAVSPSYMLRYGGVGLALVAVFAVSFIDPGIEFAGLAQRVFETLIYVWIAFWMVSAGRLAGTRSAAK